MKKRMKLKPAVRAVLRFNPYRAKRRRRECRGGCCRPPSTPTEPTEE